MSSSNAPARRPNLIVRIFNWLVGDATVDGVDPALHRRALWVAFVVLAVSYVVSFLLTLPQLFSLPEPVFNLLYAYGDPRYGIITSLPMLDYLGFWQPLFLASFIYAIVLKTRGVKLPRATFDLLACILIGYILGRTIRLKYVHELVFILVVFVLLYYHGHLAHAIARVLLLILLGVVALMRAWSLTYLYLFMHNDYWYNMYDPTWIQWVVTSILLIPLATAVPTALLARPRVHGFPAPVKQRWQLTGVLLLAGLLAATSSALYYIYRLNLIPMGLIWMVTFVLLVALLWLYFTGRATRDLLAFLALTVAGIIVIYSLIPWVAMPDWVRSGLALAAGCLLALLLAANVPLRRTNLWAALSILAGSIAAVAWDAGIVARLAERSKYLLWQVNPGWFVRLELALLVELALFIAALMLAWWFVRPAEMEALLPWLAKLKSKGKASSE